MGWARGSYLAQDIYDNIRDLIPEENRMKAADIIYSQFRDEDADDWDSESTLLMDAKIKFEDED